MCICTSISKSWHSYYFISYASFMKIWELTLRRDINDVNWSVESVCVAQGLFKVYSLCFTDQITQINYTDSSYFVAHKCISLEILLHYKLIRRKNATTAIAVKRKMLLYGKENKSHRGFFFIFFFPRLKT